MRSHLLALQPAKHYMYLKTILKQGHTPVGPVAEVPCCDGASLLRFLARVCTMLSPAVTAERQPSCKHPGNASHASRNVGYQ